MSLFVFERFAVAQPDGVARSRSTMHKDAGQSPLLQSGILKQIGSCLRERYEERNKAPLPRGLRTLAERLEGVLRARLGGPAPAFREGVLSILPNLRAFAISLTGNPDRADDLVQETIVRAWAKCETFAPGTCLEAWLFTILRNHFYSEQRRRVREVADGEGTFAARLAAPAEQAGRLDLQDLWAALDCLPVEQREALILVGAKELSYEEAAAICGCAIGTIKSRINRGRARLAELLGYEAGDFAAEVLDGPGFVNGTRAFPGGGNQLQE
jgi:RNA polymerase sigma-70 factor, ECF subfamily